MKKTLLRIFGTLFPTQCANFAYRRMSNPQNKKLWTLKIEILESAKREKLTFKTFQIQTYHWQGGAEKILLVHGWEGQASNFADLIEMLTRQSYSVYAFDGPSHGLSSKGQTSPFDFAELVEVLIKKYDVRKLVSHSFGSVATSLALFKNRI